MKQLSYYMTKVRRSLLLVGLSCVLVGATPLGRAGEAPVTLADKPLHFSLAEGECTLIVRVPNAALLEKFALLNENAQTHGQLKIAVSDQCLPANDPKWNLVNGNISFAHKRRFDLSMVGVEAKFVKLSFHVEKEQRIAAAGF